MNINTEVDNAYKNLASCRNPTTWQERAARARFRLEIFGVVHGVTCAQARRYIHTELAAVRQPELDYDTLVSHLESTASELMEFALPGDVVGIASLVRDSRVIPSKNDMLHVASQISAVPKSDWYKKESGGSENGHPYRSDPYPSASSHPDHDAGC